MDQLPYVIVALFIICTALSVIFFMAYRAFGRPPHARTWSIAFGLAATQWSLNIGNIYGVITDPVIYWPIVNLLGPAVPVLGIIGYRQRAKKYLNIPLLVGIVALSFSSSVWFMFVDRHVGISTATLPFITAATSLWAAWIIYDVPREKRSVEWGLIVTYGILAAIETIIGLLALALGPNGGTEYQGYYVAVLFLTLPAAFTVLGMFALSLIASDLAKKAYDLAEFQKLKRKEEKERSWGTLQDAIEAIPDLIAIDNGKGILVTCNEAFASFLGLPAKEIPGKSIVELIELYRKEFKLIDGKMVNSNEEIAQKMWAALTTGNSIDVTTQDDRSFLMDCGYLREGGHIMVARDVTQVNDAKVRLETAINAMPVGFSYFDKDLNLVACNKGYEELHQKPQEWIASQPVDKIVINLLRRIKNAKKQSLVVRSGWLHRVMDGIENRHTLSDVAQLEDDRWYEINTQPVKGGGIITVANDITTRKVLELDLEKNEAQLREILQGQPFPVLVVDKEESSILFASSAAVTTLIDENTELSGLDACKFLNQQPDIVGPLFGALDTESSDIQEAELSRLNGSTFPTLLSSQPITYSGLDARVISFIDMSNVQNLESELAAKQEALFQSEKLNALGTLLAGVAHELNNPLTVVVANAHILANSTDDKAVQEKLKKITNAADRCSKIVRSFLNAARKQNDAANSFDLVTCINEALDLAIFGLQELNIEITTNFEDNLPPIEGNADQLSQVLMNLVLNAKHALEEIEGKRSISISCLRSSDKKCIELHVSDNGPGIPPEIQGRIFEPFFTTKSVGQGTGMGLSLVHGIVRSHGGAIELVGGREPGTHFKISLPVSKSRQNQVDNPLAQRPTFPYRLLVVDDEPDVLEALADMLVIQGHDVHAVSTAEEALRALKDEAYDGLLSDIRMPGMDGQALFEQLQEKFPDMVERTAFITGNDLSETARGFLDTCQRPSLGKPCSPGDIESLLEEMDLKKTA